MNKLKCIVFYWVPVVVWMGVIFYFSSRTRIVVSDEYTINFLFFKTLHVLEYSALTFLLFRALYQSNKRESLTTIIFFTLCVAVLYALSDEIHQTFVPTREGRLRDVGIDLIGIVLVIGYTKVHIKSIVHLL